MSRLRNATSIVTHLVKYPVHELDELGSPIHEILVLINPLLQKHKQATTMMRYSF